MGGRRLILEIAAAIVAVLGGLAAGPASSPGHWWGPLDLVRRYPGWAVLIFAVLAVVVALLARMQDRPAAGANDRPEASPDIPEEAIRRTEAESIIAAVCSRRGRTVGITTALTGAGGFGKTTLAKFVCNDKKVQKFFRKRVYFVTVGRNVRSEADIVAKVEEGIWRITGEEIPPSLNLNPTTAGSKLGGLLEKRPRTLLVLDDVWEEKQLKPFLVGGSRCVRLVTTRVPAILPTGSGTSPVLVDRMSHAEARQVLTRELPRLSEVVTRDLLTVTGRWPLPLHLTNRMIKEQVAAYANAAAVAEETLRQLRERGPVAADGESAPMDLDNPEQRSKAVRATVEAAARLLPAEDDRERFIELGIFAANEAVPVTLTARLWGLPARTEAQSRALCLKAGPPVPAHPETRGQGQCDPARRDPRLSARRTRPRPPDHSQRDAGGRRRGRPAPGRPARALGAAADGRMVGTGRRIPARPRHRPPARRGPHQPGRSPRQRPSLVETRLRHRGPTAPWRDLSHIPTPTAAVRACDIARTAHLLGATQPAHAVTGILHSRLKPLDRWQDQVTARQGQYGQPALLNRWTPPDLPDPALLRTLTGHTDEVTALAIAPDSTWLATGSADKTVRIWDSATGRLTAALNTDPVTAPAITPDGTLIATIDYGKTVRIWDRLSGDVVAMMRTDGALSTCTWIADDRGLVVGGERRVYCYEFRPGVPERWLPAICRERASEQGRDRGGQAAQGVVVDRDAAQAPVRGEQAGLRGDRLCHQDPPYRMG